MTRLNRTTFVVCALGLALSGCGEHAVEQLDTTAAVPVTVEPVRVDTLTSEIAASGVLAPALGADWTITAPEPARIADLPKAEGDPVAVGDLLVRFDIPTLPADLAAKRAAVDQAKAAVETTKSAVARQSGLFDRGVAAKREVEDAKQRQVEAESALTQAESAVAAAAAMAARVEVRATFAGVVAKRWRNPGDLVDASASDPILRVIDPQRLQVLAATPVADLPRVVLGHPGRVIGPAGGDGEKVKVVSKPGQVEPGSATADVRLAFAAPTRLTAGATVQVLITAEERPKAIVVNKAAVVHDGDDTFVMIVGTDGKAHKRAVKVGLTGSDVVEITSGLSAGDQAIVTGQDGLPDNAAVTVVK